MRFTKGIFIVVKSVISTLTLLTLGIFLLNDKIKHVPEKLFIYYFVRVYLKS